MEGCRNVIYALSAETAATIKRLGMTYVRRISPPPNQNPENPYLGWNKTPMRKSKGNHVYATQAIGLCGNTGDKYKRAIRGALQSRGAYYMLTKNAEGMIIVIPNQRIAAFLYYG